jgi:hypothetical protein
MTVYETVDGVMTTVGTALLTPPFVWSANDRETGVRFLRGKGAGDSSHWIISDVRVSRQCRTPGTPLPVSATNTITIADTPTGATVNPLLRASVHDPHPTNVVTTALCSANITALRTGNAMEACPMKVGSPDGTRPTLGHSGAYSYNWAPLRHTLDHQKTMGIPLYFGFGGTPQVLGGGATPFTPTQCADPTILLTEAGEGNQVPSDFTQMGVIAADMAWEIMDYLASIDGEDPVGWGFWNEPDGTWQGTQLQHNQCFAAVCNAVKAVVPSVPFGGPEVSGVEAFTGSPGWVGSLIQYCAANTVDLDFISFHHYSGDVGFYRYAQAKVNAYVATYSYPKALSVNLTEWGWNSAHLYGAALYPFHDIANFWLNDWAASFDALALITGQEFGLDAMYYYAARESESSDGGFNATGLYSATKPWTPLNVMEVWRRLGNNVLTISDADLENGVKVLPTADGDGNPIILAVNHKYRMDRTTTVEATLDGDSFDDIVVLSHYVIDTDHSNYWDQGTGTGLLEMITVPTIDDGVLTFEMEPRSVHLFVMGEPVQVAETDAIYGISVSGGRPMLVQVRPNE